VLRSLLPFYTANTFPLVGGAAPFPKPDTDFRDLLSAADLAAGAFEHYFASRAPMGEGELTVDHRSDWIMGWFVNHRLLLKKHAVIVSPERDDLVRAA